MSKSRIERVKARGFWFPVLLALAGARVVFGQAAPEPMTLRRAAQRALAHSPEVAVSRAEADEAASTARRASLEFKPQAFATTTPGYSTGLPVQVAGQAPSLVALALRQTIYDPSRRAGSFEADASSAAARGAFERTEAAAARAVAVSYSRVWSDQQRLAVARRRVEAREAILRGTTSLKREGRRTDLDVESAGLQVARAKQKLLDRQTELDLDRFELARLIDWDPATPLPLAEDPLTALPETPA